MRTSNLPWFPLAALTIAFLCAGVPRERGGGDAGSPVKSKPGEPFSFPDVDELEPGDVRLDGTGYRALRVAIEDLLPPGRPPPPDKLARCLGDEANYHYQVQRRGDLYFIRIVLLPERCDPTGVYVDGGIRYVVSADGRILRKRYDGQPD